MAVYNEIIDWAANKPMFIRVAIRRLLNNQILTDQEIGEIKELLKKENGFDGISITPLPVSDADIPSNISTSDSVKLKRIESPHNITALSDRTPLEFSTEGLSVVYGKNGSGKSSYSRILKKLCWSRDKNIILKKNAYSGDTTPQSVRIKFLVGSREEEFNWIEGQDTDQRLNSIFVFDSKCADIYLNSENPAEYKPVGIDVLERLIKLWGDLSQSIDNELLPLNRTKPTLLGKYNNTSIYNWYQTIENIQRETIDSILSITEQQKEEKNVLEKSLKDTNLEETNRNLRHKRERYQQLQSQLSNIEKLFLDEKIKTLSNLKKDHAVKEQANRFARTSYETDGEFTIGGLAWKSLWNAAREYATSELHNSHPIASTDSGSFCVLCHQPLTDAAKKRLQKFELFIQDKTSLELEFSKKQLNDECNKYIEIPAKPISDAIKQELIEDTSSSIKEMIETYEAKLLEAKNTVIKYINSETEEIEPLSIISFSDIITKEIENIDTRIKANNDTAKNREEIEKRFLELEALNILVDVKSDILLYYDECVIKRKYNACKNALNTRSISNKIGELLESNAIVAQHTLFIQILNRLNPSLGAKIGLRKTRTTSGITYQKCEFNSISEKITEILSEGEQKMVSIANFMSECLLDNSKNTIVLDDPINSLDVDYRESVAKLIVELSDDRQIVVMTHDLYFLRLLRDIYKDKYSNDCYLTCLNSIEDNSGIVSDEIPYLAKNVQERIDTITRGLDDISNISIDQVDKKRVILNDLKDKMRQLLERSVEDVLINKTITRFSKNINFKKGNLASIIVVEKNDVDYLLSLYGKYSEVIHDGSVETVPNMISEDVIRTDISQYRTWKDSFVQRVREWKRENGYDS
ncbi:MAG: AAA family ATPase [Paludibacteraceae bacterium]|nr:AAA family ATPase [Paludibacteraceae bacterium]